MPGNGETKNLRNGTYRDQKGNRPFVKQMEAAADTLNAVI
jgi:hypothetical protein